MRRIALLFVILWADFAFGRLRPKFGPYKISQHRKDTYIAYEVGNNRPTVTGHYQSLINETGWSFLEIETDGSFSDEEQAYSAGYLEGFLTYDAIFMHWFNTLGDFCVGREDQCKNLDSFVQENHEWILGKANTLGDNYGYWHHVKLFYLQIEGLADGYKAANKDDSRALSYKNILWLNLQGDFDDLMEALKAKTNDFRVEEDYLPLIAKGLGHCSALIKVLPDGSDLFVAQVTWSTYQSMLRIQKKYTFNFHKTAKSSEVIPGKSMSFSSYPGVTTSGDDFYLISSGLVAMETTIGNSNISLWKFVEPSAVFEGVRSMIANRLAQSGKSWTKIFSRYNSGTYNNQWMIVDYNKFKSVKNSPPSGLPDDTLWVLEQIPGYIFAADMTNILRKDTYWASYNVAYSEFIFNISGNREMVKKFGDWFTYDKTPRALIFKRDHGKVTDLKSMYQLMRYNDYKHDPLSKCNCSPPYSAENAISARCDLNPLNGSYPFPALGHRQHGATDAKVASTALFDRGLSFMAVSGPTYNESLGIPPFQWSQSDFQNSTPHLGHPDKWMFAPFIKQWN